MRYTSRFLVLAAFTVLALFLAPKSGWASQCVAYVDSQVGPSPVSYSQSQSGNGVDITFVTHSTFRLVTPAGVVVATDFAGYAGDGPLPDIVTMNHAHETHYTLFPDPKIKHVLTGWNPEGGPIEHSLRVADLYLRNVPTDIRRPGGTVEPFGNSIFIFEVADLCIGHLGHLHHKPTPEQLARIGRLDVVFAPVDGSVTLDLKSMIEVLLDLRASLVIPMHFFSYQTLEIFLAAMSQAFDVRIADSDSVSVSLANLPRDPTVLLLAGY
ncbi:MAG: MBL fold metallo-hydrolase [Pseudomonadota bacterium]